MKAKYYLLAYVFFVSSITSLAQNTPFNCDYNAYLFQYNDVYSIDLASGNSFQIATDITPGNINAAAYNPADGFIWGSLSSPEKTIVRIGKDFLTTTYYIDELPTSNRYVGGINSQGVYYLKGGGTTYYKIDLDPNSTTYSQHLATETLSQNISIHDWAFNAVDGNLYTVEKGTNILYRINPNTSVVENLGVVPILTGLNYTYGAVYFDASGRFYVSANQTGTIYVIQNVQNLNITSAIDSNLFAYGPSSSSNDGARCPTAPVPQENCTNAIDDDGDGLIDCEDPSCSGVASCPIVQPETSGANEGGLESNNRLSVLINKRNFNRAKVNYKFDKISAPKFEKLINYGNKSTNLTSQLNSFIPSNIINEEYAIESSPIDLINITNATEVFSVDYMKNNQSIASILALKTENGVYEHTKNICDRLLGAELISVSTIEINNQSFIKSIIKNTEGTIEFVLSLSAKEINNATEFAIESHWNLDQYENNVTFYNFQIWANSLDNLLLLGEEVIHLLEVQKPIIDYNNSNPPAVFVRKGKYVNGKLELQIINTNASGNVIFDAGLRETETSTTNYISSTIDLNGNYITNLEIDTNNLFDIGFRIGDGIQTPDDLFMSDGPWGVDDSASSTIINNYTVTPNQEPYHSNVFAVERNVALTANTNEYVSIYRALTPRFNQVDLTAYNTFNFESKGTGELEIRFIKASIANWEDQYHKSVQLTNYYQEFSIPFTEFSSTNNAPLELNDIVTIIFTMVNENGVTQTKQVNLNEINFSYSETNFDTNNVIIFPNPLLSESTISFVSQGANEIVLLIYNSNGKVVKQIGLESVNGLNEFIFQKKELNSGLYFCKILSGSRYYKTVKLIVE